MPCTRAGKRNRRSCSRRQRTMRRNHTKTDVNSTQDRGFFRMKRTIHGWTLTLLAASVFSSSAVSAQQKITDERLQELIRVAAERAGVSPHGVSSQGGAV